MILLIGMYVFVSIKYSFVVYMSMRSIRITMYCLQSNDMVGVVFYLIQTMVYAYMCYSCIMHNTDNGKDKQLLIRYALVDLMYINLYKVGYCIQIDGYDGSMPYMFADLEALAGTDMSIRQFLFVSSFVIVILMLLFNMITHVSNALKNINES